MDINLLLNSNKKVKAPKKLKLNDIFDMKTKGDKSTPKKTRDKKH